MTMLARVTDSTIGSDVLRAVLPVVAAFTSNACDASTALMPILGQLAIENSGRVEVVVIDAEEEAFLAEQYNVSSTPTLIVFQHGEPITRAVGFAPEGLIRLLLAEVVARTIARQWLWSPTEEVFEETVIVPLLARWGWRHTRQAACPLPTSKGVRGRVDFLVFAGADDTPLTLFENKRQIASSRELQQAATQARTYATALGVASFVVAAPSGAWVYAMQGKRAALAGAFSSLDLHTQPQALATLLTRLNG